MNLKRIAGLPLLYHIPHNGCIPEFAVDILAWAEERGHSEL